METHWMPQNKPLNLCEGSEQKSIQNLRKQPVALAGHAFKDKPQ